MSSLWTQIKYQLIIQLKIKLQDPFTLVISFIIAPLLGLLTALIFHSNEDLVSNDSYSSFLFFMLVSSIFFGLVGSIFEIIKDLPIVKRQKLGNISTFSYYISKYIVLSLFGFIQVLLYILVSMWIMGGMMNDYVYNFFIMYLLLLNSIALGLWISSIVPSSFMAANLIPLIIVPQILLGGMIPYNSLDKSLFFGFDSAIPPAAKIVPIMYAYESSITGHINFHKNDENVNDHIVELISYGEDDFLTIEQTEKFYCKDMDFCNKTWSYDIVMLLIYLLILQLIGYFTLKRKLQ